MRNKFETILVAGVAVGCIAIGSTVAWSNIATPGDGDAYMTQAYMTPGDFNNAFTDVAAAARPENTPANREMLRAIGWKRINGLR